MPRRDLYPPVAEGVLFDNETNDFIAEDVQGAIEELTDTVSTAASPGYSFGKSGNVTSNTWLLRVGGAPSNKTGITVGFTDPVLTKITSASENLDTYDIQIYQHQGDSINLTLITTVSVVAARQASFTVSEVLTQNEQVAVRITGGSAKNVGVDLQLSGSV